MPNKEDKKCYLALGDSMSIDYYTGKTGGGAVSQFYRHLGCNWELKDFTVDGCTMPIVPRDETARSDPAGGDVEWPPNGERTRRPASAGLVRMDAQTPEHGAIVPVIGAGTETRA